MMCHEESCEMLAAKLFGNTIDRSNRHLKALIRTIPGNLINFSRLADRLVHGHWRDTSAMRAFFDRIGPELGVKQVHRQNL